MNSTKFWPRDAEEMNPSAFEGKSLATWLGWLDRVDQELLVMHMNRKVWRQTIDMMRENNHVRETGAFFANFLTRLYTDAQVMRVRRQGEVRRGVVSPARLISSIQSNPHILTRTDTSLPRTDTSPCMASNTPTTT